MVVLLSKGYLGAIQICPDQVSAHVHGLAESQQ